MNASEFVAYAADVSDGASGAEFVEGLTDFDLFYVHVDERRSSLTLGFDARRAGVSGEPAVMGVGFYVIFDDVESLMAVGWSFEQAFDYDIDSEGSMIRASIAGNDWRLSFLGRETRISGPKNYAVGAF